MADNFERTFMAKINKFGEIDEVACPNCGDPIKSDWVACPKCGEMLKESKKGSKKNNQATQAKFICPGCGEKATAKQNAIFCDRCGAYIHLNCTKEGKTIEQTYHKTSSFPERGVSTSKIELLCPKCSQVLKTESRFLY